MYPIIFENLYYEKIWGGQALSKFRMNLPEGNIGESWDIACHENGMGIISNGELKGISFKDAIDKYGHKLVGKSINKEKFPLLIKLISASDKLSIQVHPNDEFAKEEENQLGKTEAWYVLDAEEGAKLIVGTRNCTKEIFKEAIENNNLEPYLNEIPVTKGDFFYIESGMVHGICGGVTIAEIQENSDITYRVYDYNRGREIHIEKALKVINFNLSVEKANNQYSNNEGYKKYTLCSKEFFNIEKYDIEKALVEKSDEERFYLFTCVNGEGKIISKDNVLDFKYGDSILIPAFLGDYKIEGKCELLKSYVPK